MEECHSGRIIKVLLWHDIARCCPRESLRGELAPRKAIPPKRVLGQGIARSGPDDPLLGGISLSGRFERAAKLSQRLPIPGESPTNCLSYRGGDPG